MAKDFGGISHKDYLQKYLSDSNEDKKKKKKKFNVSSSHVKRSQIIDDDIDIKNMQPLDDDDIELCQLDEDAPQVVGIIDMRPVEVRAQEYYNDKKRWKVFASDDADGDITVVENKEVVQKVEEKESITKESTVVRKRKPHGDGIEKNYEKIIKTTLGLKDKRTALYKDLELSKKLDLETKEEKNINSSSKNKKDRDSVISPPRKKVNSDSDPSPPRVSSDHGCRIKNRKYNSDSDPSPPRKSSHKSRKHGDSDLSPPRISSRKNKEYIDSDASPPRKLSHKSKKGSKPDSSLPKTISRRSLSDSDSDPSPPRKSNTTKHSSPGNKISKSYKKHSDSDTTEKSYKGSSRQKGRDVSPQVINSKRDKNIKSTKDDDRRSSHKNRNKYSPARKNKQESDSDIELPRKCQKAVKHGSDSDLTPPRKLSHKKSNSPSHGTQTKYDKKHSRYGKRSDEYDSDSSVRRKSYKSYSHDRHRNSVSPLRNDDRQRRDYSRRRNSKDKSPKRKKRDESISSDDIPSDEKRVQRSKEKYKDTYDDRMEQRNKTSHSQDRSPKQSRDGKMKTTLEGKKAGLQDASAMKKELLDIKNRENQMYAEMDASVSGLGAAPVIRDRKTGRKRDLAKEKEQEAEKAAKAAIKEAKYTRWGKGLKQVEDAEEKLADTLKEMSKPLARYADDEDLDNFLKAQEREGDPMLEYIRSKQKESTSLAGSKPVYKGSYTPNRFGIRPGHRWDGVDRSNGFEKKWFMSKNARKAVEEEAYKWSTSDM